MAESVTVARMLVVSHPAVLTVNQLVYAELANRGWSVDVVVPDQWRHEYGPVTPEALPAFEGRFHRLPVAFSGQAQRHTYVARPTRLLRRLRPDVVFLEQEAFSVAALQWGRAAHRLGIPFGVQADENLDRRLPPPVRAWRSWVLRNAAFVAARSDSAGRLVTHWGARGDVLLVPHHVPEWPVLVRPPSAAFRVGYAGRLVPEKGLDVLVDAVRRLSGEVELVVAGDGPLRDWLESVDLGSATLRLLPGVDHDAMGEAYAAMDTLVLPSRTTAIWKEQFGRVLVEALWCGVPVVGSDSGEIPWVIKRTGGGRVVAEGDAAALARVLEELRADPDQRRALADRGRRVVAATFSVPAVADALGEVLQQAAPNLDHRPRVALVAHGVHDEGGMERACAELIRRKCEDFAFTVVAAELAPHLRPLVARWIRVRVPTRPTSAKFTLFFARAGFALRGLDSDLVHTVGAIVPNRADVATIHFCHAGHRAVTGRLAPPDAPRLRRINTGIARLCALGAEAWAYRSGRIRILAAVSTGVAREVETHYPGLSVSLTPNGIDVGRFRPDEHDRRGTRVSLGVPPGRCVALFVGGDWDGKGLALAIEALAKVRAGGDDVDLWVVGHGDEARFIALARSLGVQQSVCFFGRRSDTERFYRAADVFVLPSAYETFSLVCFEAAAAGLPLVIPSLSGAGELAGKGGAGIIVEREPSSIAAALAALVRDPAKRAHLGLEARRQAGRFTWEASAASVAVVYRELLSGGGA